MARGRGTGWSALAVWVLAMPGLEAQTDPVVLRAESRVVQIDVVVKDKNGRIVDDLQRSDFTIRDNGRPREFQIFSFDRGSPAGKASRAAPSPQIATSTFTNANSSAAEIPPHSTVILLDQVNGWFDDTAVAQNHVLSLLAKVPADEPIALYVLANQQGLVVLQEYTTNRELLIRHLKQYIPRGMRPAPPGMENFSAAMRDAPAPGGAGPRPNPVTAPPPPSAMKESARETADLQHRAAELVRLSLKGLALHLAGVPGRKSVFWVTQGFPPVEMRDMGKLAWDNTIHALNDANIAVNAVDSNLIGGPPRRWGGNGQVAAEIQLADRTGGRAIYHRNDIEDAMLEELQDSRLTYTLGFYLRDDERDGSFHRLEVRVDRPHLELHFRPGYFAGTNPQLESSRKADEMESLLLSPVDSAELGITVRVDHRESSLDLGIRLDTRTVTLTQQADGWSGGVKEMFVETDAEGHELMKISDTKKFEIPAADRVVYDRDGLPLTSTLPLEEGAQKLAIVIRDLATGRTGLLTVPLAQGPR